MSEASTPKVSPPGADPGGAGGRPPGISRDPDEPSTEERRHTRRLVSASALMAGGTATSRVLGYFRLVLLVYLFGNGTRQAEMFTIATTVPNSMYILLAGGVLNTVLVPQIVRAIRGDADRGEAYTNRIMTAGLIALGSITLLLTLAVPAIVSIYSAAGWKSPELSAQYQSMIMLAYYCMPQVFFYGVHVMAGQVLNARDRFGPMMWAPIANNVVSIMVLLLYLIVFERTSTGAPFTAGQELLLGLGSTLGIAAQAAVLIPFLRASGYHFRPRFDFKNTGLGKTFRLAKWTLGLRPGDTGRIHRGDQARQRRHRRRRGRRAHRILQRVRGVDPAPLVDNGLVGHRDAAGCFAARRRRRPTGRGCGNHAGNTAGDDRAATGLGRLPGIGAAPGTSGLRFRPGRQGRLLRRRGAHRSGDRAGAIHGAIHLPTRLLRAGGHAHHLLPAMPDRRHQCRPRRGRGSAARRSSVGGNWPGLVLFGGVPDRSANLLREAASQASRS